MDREDSAAKEYSLKLEKVRHRGYSRMGEVKSLTNNFLLMNKIDTRMVYKRTSSGLNIF